MDELHKKIISLSKDDRLEARIEMRSMLEQAIKIDLDNVSLLLRLALLEFHFPFLEYEKSIDLLEKNLKKDPSNPVVLLMLACVHYYSTSLLDKSLLKKLISVTTNDRELNSLLKYAASWFYYITDSNNPQYKQLLIESTNLCHSHVYNYQHLALFYLEHDQISDAKKCIHQAVCNVRKIYKGKEGYDDITDIQEFINERLKGTYLTDVNFRSLKILEAIINIKEKLIDDPYNADLLLKLSVNEFDRRDIDYEECLTPLKKILSNTPDNAFALLLLGYGSYRFKGYMENELFEKLVAVKTSNTELKALFIYVASWFYLGKDEQKREVLLKQSVNECSFHVRNYVELASLCLKQQRFSEAEAYIQKAIANIVVVYDYYADVENIGSVERYIDKYIKGTHLTNYELGNVKKLEEAIKSKQPEIVGL